MLRVGSRGGRAGEGARDAPPRHAPPQQINLPHPAAAATRSRRGAAAASPAPAAAPAASAPRQSYDRVASVVAQLEFYFSEKNLARDEYLRGLLEQKGAWVVRRCIPRA